MPENLVSIHEATRILGEGGIVVYPTETMWAIGCKITAARAVNAICLIKGRPQGKPLPLLAANVAQAAEVADMRHAPAALLARYWPGPLTVVMPAVTELPNGLTGSGKRVAIRVTSSPVAATLAAGAGSVLCATSANLSGARAAQKLSEIQPEFLERCGASGLPWGVAVAGATGRAALPSTIVEPVFAGNCWRLKLLRQGAISKDALLISGWKFI